MTLSQSLSLSSSIFWRRIWPKASLVSSSSFFSGRGNDSTVSLSSLRSKRSMSNVGVLKKSYRTINNKHHISERCNGQIRRQLSVSSANNEKGLFGLEGLMSPCDFGKLTCQTIERINSIRRDLKQSVDIHNESNNLSTSSKRQILYLLDDISNEVCSVIDAAELCRCVHSDKRWRESAHKAFVDLSHFIAELNADVHLYQALTVVTNDMKNNSDTKCWTEEQKRMALLLQREFERDGIHLPDKQRDQIQQLSGHIVQLESIFSNNIQTSSNTSEYYSITDANQEIAKFIPPHMLPTPLSTTIDNGDNTNVVTLDKSNVAISNTILKYCENSNIRKEVYMESNTSCPENLLVLDELLKRRHEFANMLQFESYGHFFCKDKMAKTPANVLNFLNDMKTASQPTYQKDMELLSRLKQQVEPSSTSAQIDPWDIPYYMGLVKQIRQHRETGSSVEESLSGHFDVEQSIQSMIYLVQQLFNIEMKEDLNTTPSDKWDTFVANGDNRQTSMKSRIRKFTFHHPEEGPLGVMYLDLFPRPDKYAHAAHFTVRCGCQTNRTGNETHSNVEYQLPIIALVCNLSPSSSSLDNPGDNNIELLSHSEVETLFHEFGHALHSLLSRTSFQHLSGTRASMDFIETPSHLLEYYVWNDEFLHNHLIASSKHHRQPPSQAAVSSLTNQRNAFKSIDIQQQVVYSLFDQALHSNHDDVAYNFSTIDLMNQLHQQNGVPFAPGTHWHSKFGHLVTYGAGYYSYLYASVFAADIWQTCFENDPLNRKSGTVYWNEMLRHGGAKDPNSMLQSLLKRPPKVDSFFKTISSAT